MASSKKLSKKIAKIPRLWLIVILLAAVGLIGYLFMKNQTPKTPYEVLLSLKQNLNTSGKIIIGKSMGILNKEGKMIISGEINTGERNWRIENEEWLPLKGKSLSADINWDLVSDVQDLKPIISNFFAKNGFVSNNANTINANYTGGLMQLGFEKNQLMCIVELYQLDASYFCGEVDYDRLALRKEFGDGSPRTKTDIAAGISHITNPDKVIGNFATGTQNSYENGIYQASGIRWFAVKLNGKWKFLSAGQQLPFCKDMDKYSFPREIYGNCYLDNINYTLRFKE